MTSFVTFEMLDLYVKVVQSFGYVAGLPNVTSPLAHLLIILS
ncbi:hypothetical protein SOVF_182710 [Spinacia oleracea]|nr:hypothetical protein SOVF_182710 [Spinacia oleracea]